MVLFNSDPFAAWNVPFGRLQRTADRLFHDVLAGPSRPASPAVNLYASQEAVTLVAEVPGYASGQIEVRVEDGALILEGQRVASDERAADDAPEDGNGALKTTFRRAFRLPYPVDVEHVEARLSHGVLHVTAPRLAASAPRSIPVLSAAE